MNKKYVEQFLTLCFIVLVGLNISSCSKDDEGNNNELLNNYEAALVGYYISDDDDYEILYLTLTSDRTGSFELKWHGETKSKYNIIWSATRTTFSLTNQSNGKTYNHEYVLDGKHLVFSGTSYQKQ